jgi:hypothetical protein
MTLSSGTLPNTIYDLKDVVEKDKKSTRTGKADVAINYTSKLYAIEKQAEDETSEVRR